MISLDILAALSGLLLTLYFYLFRTRLSFFCIGTVTAVCFLILIAWRLAEPAYSKEFVTFSAGCFLYGFGLFIVRIVLQRSVSLKLLAAISSDSELDNVQENIAGRLRDATRYRLAKSDGNKYELTALGRILGTILRSLYWLTGQER
jgi:hypothetical protein